MESSWLASCHGQDCGAQPFILDRGEHPEGAVAALPVVEDLQVLEIALASSIRVFHRRRSSSSVCMRAQNDSIMPLLIAIDSALVTSVAVWVESMDQPTWAGDGGYPAGLGSLRGASASPPRGSRRRCRGSRIS